MARHCRTRGLRSRHVEEVRGPARESPHRRRSVATCGGDRCVGDHRSEDRCPGEETTWCRAGSPVTGGADPGTGSLVGAVAVSMSPCGVRRTRAPVRSSDSGVVSGRSAISTPRYCATSGVGDVHGGHRRVVTPFPGCHVGGEEAHHDQRGDAGVLEAARVHFVGGAVDHAVVERDHPVRRQTSAESTLAAPRSVMACRRCMGLSCVGRICSVAAGTNR